jgi:hypothetical protein
LLSDGGGAKARIRRGVMAAFTGLNIVRRRIPSRSDWRFFNGDVYLRRMRSLAAFSGDFAYAVMAAAPTKDFRGDELAGSRGGGDLWTVWWLGPAGVSLSLMESELCHFFPT